MGQLWEKLCELAGPYNNVLKPTSNTVSDTGASGTVNTDCHHLNGNAGSHDLIRVRLKNSALRHSFLKLYMELCPRSNVCQGDVLRVYIAKCNVLLVIRLHFFFFVIVMSCEMVFVVCDVANGAANDAKQTSGRRPKYQSSNQSASHHRACTLYVSTSFSLSHY